MNIFEVLSQGKSRLHETSISAMLGYLLSPSQDHGLRDTFLRSFLDLCREQINNSKSLENILEKKLINANIELEVQYYQKKKRSDIDIQISLLDETNSKEIHRIIIENKIKVSSGNPNQLLDYYEAILNDEDFQLEKPELTIVFLTPKAQNTTLTTEFNNLKDKIKEKHNCLWVFWSNNEDSISVLSLIKDILRKELASEINPINEYMRHTLKAFVNHVSLATIPRGSKMRKGEDIGDIVEEVEITMHNNKSHRIIRRDSTQIQVFDLDTNEKEIARHIMAQYIDENKIDIPHAKLNTRMIGKKLLEFLRKQDFDN